MPGTLNHLDELALLRIAAGDLDELDARRAERHLRSCAPCREGLQAAEVLDESLRALGPRLVEPPDQLPKGDVFRSRPGSARTRPSELGFGPGDIAACAAASREAGAVSTRLLAAGEADLDAALSGLDLGSLQHRYALSYALSAARTRMAEGARRWRGFADAALARLSRTKPRPVSIAEIACPLADLLGDAHLLAGFARNWTADFDLAGEHLAAAYERYGEGACSERSFALVELHESQRRSFTERASEGLHLAERAKATFTSLGLGDEAARAGFARGIALSYLERDAEAVEEFRATLPIFAEAGLWNAYGSVLNNLGTSLLFLERLDEAKQEYARALKLVSTTERPAIHAFLRHNLATLLLRSGRYREAARAFHAAARLFERQGSRHDAFIARLYLVEAQARGGSLGPARRQLEAIADEARTSLPLDSSTLRALARALAGEAPDLEAFAQHREKAADTLREAS